MYMYTMPITQDLMYTVYMFIFYIALANDNLALPLYNTNSYDIVLFHWCISCIPRQHATVVRWLLVEFEQQSQNIYESK